MNKTELVARVAKETGLTQKDARAAVDAVIKLIASELKQGKPVKLVGFGTFSVVKRARRVARNPFTGEEVLVRAHKAPTFKSGKALKKAVKGATRAAGGSRTGGGGPGRRE